MTPAVQSILLNGLTCGSTGACEGGTLLTAGPFSLFCEFTPEAPPDIPDSSGGGIPYNAGPINTGDIARVDYPAQAEQPILIPLDPNAPFIKRAPVTLKLKWGEQEIEKIYMVRMNKLTILIKIIDIANTTKHGISIRLKKIKKINHNISIKLKSTRYFKGWRSSQDD